MMKIVRNFIVSAAVGFMVPTLTVAATVEPPPAANTKYLFELSYNDVEGAVGFALADKGAGAKISATVTGRKNGAVFSYNKPISVELRGLQFDKAKASWNASLLFISEGETVSAMPVAGRFEEMVEIPMLTRQVRAGDVISEKDVEIRDYPMSRTRSDTIGDMASLIGKSPERSISAGRPVYEREIALPIIVEKDAMVQIQYRSPGMEISVTGQATEPGRKGGIIAVRNLSSKKLVRAVVEDASTVTITSPSAQSNTGVKGETYAAK